MRPVPKKKPSPSDPLILLVDDVADNIDVYTQFFLHRGWRTATASNGQEGLTSAAGLRPDVIVLDLGKQLRQRGQAPKWVGPLSRSNEPDNTSAATPRPATRPAWLLNSKWMPPPTRERPASAAPAEKLS